MTTTHIKASRQKTKLTDALTIKKKQGKTSEVEFTQTGEMQNTIRGIFLEDVHVIDRVQSTSSMELVPAWRTYLSY